MASFNIEIPDEYLGGGEDFGFTTVDADVFEQQNQQEREVAEEVAGEISSSLTNQINSKMSILEGKINSVLSRLEDNTGEDSIDSSIDLNRIEDKIDKILAMENTELAQSIQDQGASIRAIIDEVEERKNQLETLHEEKMVDLEKLVLPLLINLTKNPEKEYLYWPDRVSRVQDQIKKVLEVTRG